MADGDHQSRIEGGVLSDAAGNEWTTKHTRWASRSQANSFAKRDGISGLLDGPGDLVRWMNSNETGAWWAEAKDHFEVPGAAPARRDEHGRTWTARVWRRGDARLIVFETNC